MFMLPACEKSIDQSQVSFVDQNTQITTRSDECENCEFTSCCCCLIEMVTTNVIKLKICGVCDGDYVCGPFSPNAPCSTVSGGGKDITLTSPFFSRQYFCAEPGASIRIENISGYPVTFEFTCQADPTPTPIIVSLTTGEIRYFLNDGECLVDDCP